MPAGTQHPATFDLSKLSNTIITSILVLVQLVRFTTHLTHKLELRPINHPNQISDIANTPFGDFNSSRIIAVGSGTTQFYADPVINEGLQPHL